MSSPPFRCAEAAQGRGDPLLGTAPTYRTYLLIEHPGPWRYDALSGAGWSTKVTDVLTAAVRETRTRLLLIRRPGRRSSSAERAWAVVQVGVGAHWATWRHEDDLLVTADALRAYADPSTPTDVSILTRDPVLLVCAHGVHDTCCALRGRPVAAALARTWPMQTWECSHVGGDRFAANVVVLPDGTYYGGLDAGSATGTVTAHLGGHLDLDHLRGTARWPPVPQVAVGEIHRRLGPYGPGDVRPEAWSMAEPGRWLVRVVDPAGDRHLVEVVAEHRPAAVLTCAAAHPTSATSFRVVSVRPAAG